MVGGDECSLDLDRPGFVGPFPRALILSRRKRMHQSAQQDRTAQQDRSAQEDRLCDEQRIGSAIFHDDGTLENGLSEVDWLFISLLSRTD